MIHDRTREFIARFGAAAPQRIAEPIRIEIERTWAQNANAQHGFLTAVNLAARLTDCVVVDCPSGVLVDVWHPIGTSRNLLDRAEEICVLVNRPAVREDPSITVSFGGTTTQGTLIRPSARGWVAEVRTDGTFPSPTGHAFNPCASGFAACLAISEAFKEILTSLGADRIFPHRNLVFSLLSMEASHDGEEFLYPVGSDVGPLAVVGAGALGHSLTYGLCAGSHRGTVHIVDFDDVEPTNFNRHIMADSRATGNKAMFLSNAAAAFLNATPFPIPYGEYRKNPHRRLDRVISLVDNRNGNEARRQIQSDLPRTLHHAATGDTSFTVMNVDFVHAGCMGCLFAPSVDDMNPLKRISDLTGIPFGRISQMGPRGRLNANDLADVRQKWGLGIGELSAFLGQPLQALVDSKICGEQRIVTQKGAVNASIGFLSAAAGLALAAEVVKATSGLSTYALDNFLQVSPFSLEDRNKQRLPKNPRCATLCGDTLMQRAYQTTWGLAAA